MSSIHFHSTVGSLKRVIYKILDSLNNRIVFDVEPESVTEEVIFISENSTIHQDSNFNKNNDKCDK